MTTGPERITVWGHDGHTVVGYVARVTIGAETRWHSWIPENDRYPGMHQDQAQAEAHLRDLAERRQLAAARAAETKASAKAAGKPQKTR